MKINRKPSLTQFGPAVALLVVLLSLANFGCDSGRELISPSDPTRVPATATVPTESDPAPTPAATPVETEPVPGMTPTPSGLVLPVSIADVPSDLPEYDRQSWRHWIDEDGDCQNARQEVLIAESTVPVTFQLDEQCRVAAGQWVGPYTGTVVDDPGDLDVDHMVPLNNAHRSGAWSWSREQKRDYANYLEFEDHLIATTSGANRSKGSKGPEEWRPPLQAYWCAYAIDWVTIKDQWELTVTEAEYIALTEMLATCETTVLLQPTQGTLPRSPSPTATAGSQTAVPAPPADLRYDPFGADRDCGEFGTYEEALAFFLAAGGPETDRHRLDVNGDGQPCESLPGGPSSMVPSVAPENTASASTSPEPGAVQPDADCLAAGTLRGSHANLTVGLAQGEGESECEPVSPPSTPPALPPLATPAATPALVPSPTPLPSPETSPTPVAAALVQEPEPDVDCSDFLDQQAAQEFFLSEGGPSSDPHGLDGDNDGMACQSLPAAPGSEGARDDQTGPATPSPGGASGPETGTVVKTYVGLAFDPTGPDRNCSDFASWWDAQNFYLAAGGPVDDPHGLDRNGDGISCESLPGTPEEVPEPPVVDATHQGTDNDFEDRNCADFSDWSEAQDFYYAAGGPHADPHRLDRNNDGIACETLPGAPEADRNQGQQRTPPPAAGQSQEDGNDFEDRNCSDFETWREAQDFFEAEGGPAQDPHRLDRDKDAIVCESLPGAPDG